MRYRPYVRISFKNETFDLIISWLVLSVIFSIDSLMRKDLTALLYSVVAVGTAFVVHELAHREVAKRYGLIAKYRAWYLGLAIALALALITSRFGKPIIFAAPGAVVIYGYYGFRDLKAELRIAEAGPLSNIILALIMWVFLKSGALAGVPYAMLYYISSVNSWIALFNLLPIPPLDGFKIFKASPMEWLVMFLLSIGVYMTA